MLLQLSRRFFVFPAVCILVFVAGCGGEDDKWADERPTPVPATGTVLYQGEPVAEATVLFIPIGHNHAATALTDETGQFQLQTFDPGDGAVPGEYKVTVRKVEVITAGGAAQDDVEAPPPVERSLLPVKYADANTSGLTASVKDEGENTFNFELTEGPLTGPSRTAPRGAIAE